MRVVKVLNTSIVLAKRNDNKEVIAMGKGIGFRSRPGDMINENEIEKVYIVENEGMSSDMTALMRETPEEYLILADEIISYAKQVLSRDLSENLYFSLTDHLHMAAKRFKSNITIQNRMLWEVQKFYPQEFLIGKQALKFIKDKLGLDLPEEEAANIAFHLVNAQQTEQNMSQVMMMTTTVKDILNIIRIHYGIELDTSSINYSRFLTHLQFFVQRLLENTMLESKDDELLERISSKYPEESNCVSKINNYIGAKFERFMSNEERLYLIIHISRVMDRAH
ncbi:MULTISPECIES: BglG family transcription antiterminator LicT [Paenibacillus]|uniref:BglG family transcription antiterminator LicT n=1 Tax=Paenibacillus TaxID=44249 RepID=UPI00280C2164|nr:PRD domain-containing protein [Paenibacillus polysaccharolyticus]MDP9697785.1 beta-glucoside operon transcriptional antiterminator [Paenibacillus intestini]